MYSAEPSLEDLLRRNEPQRLVEICEELRRFITFEISVANQQNAGARHRFYGLFLLILERIFGADDSASSAYSSGWLERAAASGFTLQPRGLPQFRIGSVSAAARQQAPLLTRLVESLSRDGQALYRLLDPHPQKDGGSLFTVVQQRNHPVQFTLSCTTLPGRTQFLLAGNGTYTRVRTANAQLYLRCLSIPPRAQSQLQTRRDPALMLHMLEYYCFSFCRWPTRARGRGNSNDARLGGPAKVRTEAAGQRERGMGQDHQASFARLSRLHGASYFQPCVFLLPGLEKGRARELLARSPYHALVVAYLRFLLPHADRAHPATGGSDHRRLSADAELFLRSAIEWWLEANSAEVANVQRSFSVPSAMTTPPLQRRGMQAEPIKEMDIFPLGDFAHPTEATLKAIYALVLHMLGDPELERLSHFGSLHAHHHPGAVLRLPHALEVLQQPLFVFLTLYLRHASTHAASATAFGLVIEIWLLLLQPWKAPSIIVGGGVSDVGYTPEWRFYVVASFHFYGHLLGAFVRRTRDLDFSQPKEALRHMDTVHAVVSVFSAPLRGCLAHVQALDSSLSPDSWDRQDQGGLKGHLDRLEHYCPPTPGDLALYRADAENLLLELHMSATFGAATPDRGSAEESWLGISLFPSSPQPTSPKPNHRVLERLRAAEPSLRQLFGIPDSFRPGEVLQGHSGRFAGPGRSAAEPAPEVVEAKTDLGPALLSDAGRDQLVGGWRRSRAADVCFAGDPLSAPICSFEIGLLVVITVRLSMAMNRWLELPRADGKEPEWVERLPAWVQRPLRGFRFNLRFLADYRNLLFFALVYACARVLSFVVGLALAPGPPPGPRAPRRGGRHRARSRP